jgi:hypothetical protein
MKPKILALASIIFSSLSAQNTKTDGDWSNQLVELKGTPEADYKIRIGDIDNLGYGWPEDFNPFSGRSTDSHEWPLRIIPEDIAGMDRVIIPSSFIKNSSKAPCMNDGYSEGDHKLFKVVPFEMPLESIKDAEIKSASMLIFVDDFQSPVTCSKFRVWFNGQRITPAEKNSGGS